MRPCAAEGFFRAGEGEVAGGEIRGILQFENLGTDPTIVNKIKGLRGFGGGKHAFYRSFRVDG